MVRGHRWVSAFCFGASAKGVAREGAWAIKLNASPNRGSSEIAPHEFPETKKHLH